MQGVVRATVSRASEPRPMAMVGICGIGVAWNEAENTYLPAVLGLRADVAEVSS